MGKRETLAFMLIIIGIGVYYGGFNIPLADMTYAPPAAVYIQEQEVAVQVFGYIKYENATPAIGIDVRVFATDQLLAETLTTDNIGYFVSTMTFYSGQMMTISIGKPLIKREIVFIPYNAVGVFDLGVLYI